ncbi:MAG: response regulator [Oligoflexia bacterium]|nr:response regulator [Oligoflexia bacterium]
MTAAMLIVDDEQESREMLSRHFRYLGYEVALAGNGLEALEQLAGKKFDVLISDIMMPQMDGVALLRQVRNDYPMLRPIMITGQVTMDNALACIRYGADYCFFKPLTDLTQLEKAVSESLSKNQYWMQILKELRGMK